MKNTPLTTVSLALALAGLGHAAHAGNQGPGAIVGEATMVIGSARLVGDDGAARLVSRGAAVRVGDRIETEAGGHVHLRFVDGGRLSVRPASRLQIESYSHAPEQPQLGAIKFRLDEGVVRSITGTWGEAARERFRLNTPVAAIGVKGTDFVVRSDFNSTAASVYTGAITVTPLTNGCGTSVGPCLNGNEKLLSDDMKGQMLELGRRQATPMLVSAVELLARSQHRAAPSSESVAVADKPLAIDASHAEPGGAKNLVNESRAVAVVAMAPSEPTPPPVAPVTPPPEVMPPVVQPTPPVVEPPVVAIVPPQVTQLGWVRYGWTPKTDTDTFTHQFEQAVAAGLERAWGNANYVVFRLPTPAGATLAPTDASASFRLANSAAHLTLRSSNKTEAVNVDGGSLFVDFSRSTFSTMLALSSPTIGGDQIGASGTVRSNGTLQATQGNAALGGALSLDGQDAAYAFEKAHAAGILRGVTLWGR